MRGRRVRAALTITTALALLAALPTPAGRAGPPQATEATVERAAAPAAKAAKAAKVRDPERSSQALTLATWSPETTIGLIKDQAKQKLRVIDLEIVGTSPLRFSAAKVHNTGTYARKWWFYVNQSAAKVGKLIKKHNGRLLDLERYTVGGKERYVIVLVRNTGKAAKKWWWQRNRSVGWLKDYAKEKKARIVDLDSRLAGNKILHDAVLIRNTGVDASKWWFYGSISSKKLEKRLATNKARLVDLERVSTGRWSAVMERNAGQTWWWWYNRTAPQVEQLVDQLGARPYHVEPYRVGPLRRYAVIMIDDVNAENGRLRDIFLKRYLGAHFGFYLKPVGGSPVLGLQQRSVFEPASTIKVLHHLHQLRRVASGDDGLSDDDFAWYHYPNSSGGDGAGVCPNGFDELFDGNRAVDPISFGLQQMMQISDNRTTRGFQLRYGNAALNATADLAGMTNTRVRQVLGCGFRDGLRNDLTLVDAGRLYEGVVDGSLLSDAFSARPAFWRLMNGGPIPSDGRLADIVREEGADLGVSATRVARFIERFQTWSKGGSYDVCWPGGSACDPPYQYIRTGAGRASLPRLVGGAIVQKEYVYGNFVEEKNIDCRFRDAGESAAVYGTLCPTWNQANATLNTAGAELFRAEIRKALATWK